MQTFAQLLPGAWPKLAEVEATKLAHHLALRFRSLNEVHQAERARPDPLEA
jgi:hypothetical protein